MEFKSNYITRDEWLTSFLGCNSYRLYINDKYLESLKKKDDKESQYLTRLLNSKVFMFSKVQPHKIEQICFLEKHHFNLIDTNIIFEKKIKPFFRKSKDYDVRFALPEDELQTMDLASRSFTYSRFHLDSAITNQKANALKKEWAGNFFKNKRGDAMVLAISEGNVVGFLQLLYDIPEATLLIDLIGVDSKYRRIGVASSMISFAEAYCGDFKNIRVGTQLANIPSIKFYQNNGYKLLSSNYVFHYHNKPRWRRKHQ